MLIKKDQAGGQFPNKRVFPKGALTKEPHGFYYVVYLYYDSTQLIKTTGRTNSLISEEIVDDMAGDFAFKNYWDAWAYFRKIVEWRRKASCVK